MEQRERQRMRVGQKHRGKENKEMKLVKPKMHRGRIEVGNGACSLSELRKLQTK